MHLYKLATLEFRKHKHMSSLLMVWQPSLPLILSRNAWARFINTLVATHYQILGIAKPVFPTKLRASPQRQEQSSCSYHRTKTIGPINNTDTASSHYYRRPGRDTFSSSSPARVLSLDILVSYRGAKLA